MPKNHVRTAGSYCDPNLFAAERRLRRDFIFIACFTLAHSRVEARTQDAGGAGKAPPIDGHYNICNAFECSRSYPCKYFAHILRHAQAEIQGYFEQKYIPRAVPFVGKT